MRHSRFWLAAVAIVLAAVAFWLFQRQRESPTESYLQATREADNKTALIFVHGLYGDGRGTFQAPGGPYWPTLVTEDPLFKDVDVFVYGYSSDWKRTGLTVDQLADDMNLRIDQARLADRYDRLIFLCHSMGGLVTRAYVTRYASRVRDKIAFLYFFGTPSSGADLATLARAFLPTTHLKDLSPADGETFLRSLQTAWLAAGFGRTIPSYCAYETAPYPAVGLIVPWASAFGLCNEGVIAIEGNHAQIVKPASVDAKAHVALRAAFMESERSHRRASVKLVPGRMLNVSYDKVLRQLTLTFNGAVRSAEGSADVVQDVYGRIDTQPRTSASQSLPVFATDVRCARPERAVELPFVLNGTELACTIRKAVGDLSLAHLATPGRRRLVVTFETDEKRGHTVEYCFPLREATIAELLEGGAFRILNTSCEQGDS